MSAVSLSASPLPTRPIEPLQERLLLLDLPEEWALFSSPVPQAVPPHRSAGSKAATTATTDTDTATVAICWESRLVIEGMRCAACAFSIEQALLATPGVLQAEVNAASQRARVVWSAQATRPSAWMGAVQRAGYTALPAGDALLREARQRTLRQALWRWLVAGFCMMQVMMYAAPVYLARPGEMTPDMLQLLRWASWVLSLPVICFSCGPFFSNAWRDLRRGRINMDLPVALGMAITFGISSAGTFNPGGVFGQEVYFDSLTMFVFFLLTGRWLELRLRDRTAGALEALTQRLPDSVLRAVTDGEDGRFERVALRRLRVGDLLQVLPGEAFPADGKIVLGQTLVDEALLSGESRPLPRAVGAHVLAGSNNLLAAVQLRIERLGADTRFAQIVALMEDAAQQKPRLAQLADRMATPFLWMVLLAAVGAGAWWWPSDPGHALMVSAAVLIVTCPCALSLATPAALLAAAGSLARGGVLVRDLRALEALAEVDSVIFDKTGTLTQDGLAVVALRCRDGVAAGAVLALAAQLAAQSLHPVSRALVRHQQQAPLAQEGGWTLGPVHERSGAGLSAELLAPGAGVDVVGTLRLGSAAFCDLPASGSTQNSPEVHLSDASGWLASFVLAEDVRVDAGAAVAALAQAGVSVRLLSGDAPAAVARVAAELAAELGGAPVFAVGACSPDDKLEWLRRWQAEGRRVAMVGDGLNDGPVLAAAHASFAFGLAVPLAQAQSDFVVLGDQLLRVPQTLLLARRALGVVRQNLGWAAAYNAVCVPLAMVGWLPAWLAGLGMALSSLFVVLNAARLSRPLPP